MVDYDKRRQTLIKKYGSEEKLKEHYRDMQRKSRENYSGDGGFRNMDKQKAREIQSKGGRMRWQKKSDSN